MSQVKAKQLEGVHADQLLDNLITAIVDPTVSQDISQGYKPSSVWVNTALDKVFICSDNSLGAAKWIEIKESSGASLTVTQALHGYSLCEVLKFNGTSYVRAQSDIQANVGIWLITKIIDANTFVISSNGYFTSLTGGVADTTGYLSSTTAGGLVTTAPAISQPIIYWTSATTGWILGYPSSQASVSPSSTPLGYNDLRVGFTGSTWTYEGLTNNGGGIPLTGSIVVSGAAGWRNLVVDTLGVISVETIPPAEIIADTQQFTPTPIFNVANNCYMSSVNPTYRIIAIGYFDGTNLLEVIPYGNGSRKNDDRWISGLDSSATITAVSERFQFLGAFNKTRGSNVSIVDFGYALDDTGGVHVISNGNGEITIELLFTIAISTIGSIEIFCNKKGSESKYITGISTNAGATAQSNTVTAIISDIATPGDFYTFFIGTKSGSSLSYLYQISASFKEF